MPYRRLTAGPGLPASIWSTGVPGAAWASKRPAVAAASVQAARNPFTMGVIVRVFIFIGLVRSVSPGSPHYKSKRLLWIHGPDRKEDRDFRGPVVPGNGSL